jgi:hypothetical protein
MIKYFDFDGTLAYYDSWKGQEQTGGPVPSMIEKLKEAIAKGDEVVIFTARLTPGGGYGPCDREIVIKTIENWCVANIGCKLPITNIKGTVDVIYDDRARQIVKNLGLTIGEFLRTIIQAELVADSTKEDSLKYLEGIIKDVERV